MAQSALSPTPPTGAVGYLKMLGPGIAMAATGVGAGDLVAASKAGADWGYALIWAALAGALLKYVLNEGLARWQLATGETLLEGWVSRLGRWVSYFFLVYLLVWSFVVSAALQNACGLAAHAMAPGWSVQTWAIVHAVAAGLFVVYGGYQSFEWLMKVFIAVMVAALFGCALFVQSPAVSLAETVSQAGIPPGSTTMVLSVMGGVGGSLTLLAYGYWIKEKGWAGEAWLKPIRFDLGVAYLLTGLFGAAVMLLAAVILHPQGVGINGAKAALDMSGMIGDVLGPAGRWLFLIGFWGAVATSILGVWQADPYLFCDFLCLLKQKTRAERDVLVRTDSAWYRAYLLWLIFPPMCLLWLDKPVQVVIVYTVTGALFMPFLAGTLLYMNNRRDWVGSLKSGWLTNLLLVLALVLFAYLGLTGEGGGG